MGTNITDVLGKLANPADIQRAIDDQIEQRGLGTYVEYIRYVPQGGTPPGDATHVLELVSLGTKEAVVIAIKARGVYGLLADGILAVL